MDKIAKKLLLYACLGAVTSALVPSLVTTFNWWNEKRELRPVLILSWAFVGLLTLSFIQSTAKWLKD